MLKFKPELADPEQSDASAQPGAPACSRLMAPDSSLPRAGGLWSRKADCKSALLKPELPPTPDHRRGFPIEPGGRRALAIQIDGRRNEGKPSVPHDERTIPRLAWVNLLAREVTWVFSVNDAN